MSEVDFRFPGIFRQGIALPCSQVLSLARGALVGNDGFHLVLFFWSDQVWGWCREVGAMCIGLFVQGQEGGMEDIMDFPCGG